MVFPNQLRWLLFSILSLIYQLSMLCMLEQWERSIYIRMIIIIAMNYMDYIYYITSQYWLNSIISSTFISFIDLAEFTNQWFIIALLSTWLIPFISYPFNSFIKFTLQCYYRLHLFTFHRCWFSSAEYPIHNSLEGFLGFPSLNDFLYLHGFP